jgi:hypothetical protein
LRPFASSGGTVALAFSFVLAASATAQAQELPPEPAPEPPKPAAPARPPPPAPYSLPWQLRGVTAATSIRSDTTLALYEDAASHHGSTVASLLTGSLRIPHTGPKTAGLVAVVRGAMVEDTSPAGRGGFAIVNPVLGAAYALVFPHDLRASFSLSATLPVGMGGGDDPNARHLQARLAGPQARSQLDGSIFSSDDFTVAPGIDFAWVAHGVTLQAEATLFQFNRARGSAKQAEASKTNTTYGIHAGYFVLPELSVGAELRYQRWLNAPFAVENDPTGASRDTLTGAIGPRVHVALPGHIWIRPGIAYARGFDKPMAAATPNVHIVQLDIPVVF